MENNLLKTRTEQYYDYFEIETKVQSLTKKSLNDYAGKFNTNALPNTPYWDWWHKVIDWLSERLHNPCMVTINFEDMKSYYKDDPWVGEICDMFVKVIGPSQSDDNEDGTSYKFWIEW